MNLIVYQQCTYSPDTADLLAAAWAIDRCTREESGVGATIAEWQDTPQELSWVRPTVLEYDRIFVLNLRFPFDLAMRTDINYWAKMGKQVAFINPHGGTHELLEKISGTSEKFEVVSHPIESTATLAWEYFNRTSTGRQMPVFLEYVRDRALNRNLLPMSKEINERWGRHAVNIQDRAYRNNHPSRDYIFSMFDHMASLSRDEIMYGQQNKASTKYQEQINEDQ